MKLHFEDERVRLYQACALDLLASLDDASINLIFADPPYFKVKPLWWDRQWESEASFLDWIGALCDEFKRALAPNGSLYVCASPAMSWAVEGVIRQRFNVLNSVRWYKDAGWHKKAKKEELRSYLTPWEAVIFAEQWGADSNAMSGSGYNQACDEARGFVFEPLRTYLASEWKRAGLKFEQANEACGTASMAGRHYFSRSQWCLPTAEHYASLQCYINRTQPGEYLKRDYESLKAEFESLRRPFNSTKELFRDDWHYDSVPADDIKHPTEKPLQMLLDIVQVSSRPSDVVLDPFMGRCSTGAACAILGKRRFIGGDIQEHWCKASVARLKESRGEMRVAVKRPAKPKVTKGQMSLL